MRIDDDMDLETEKSDLELMIGAGERILWKGRPNKKCYVLEGIFNPMLPFALVWFLFDSVFVFAFLAIPSADKNPLDTPYAIIPFLAFFLLHLMPVWIYLAGTLFVFRKYKHTEYIVTDKGVYVSGGLFAYTCQMKPYTEVSRINIHRGIFDQKLKVGDVVLSTNGIAPDYSRHRSSLAQFGNLTIADIPDYQKVFELVKRLQTDVYSDTMYPNDLRPEENHGYKTKYTGV